MARRIVQMLVTVAVDTDCLAAGAQEEIERLLAASWPSVIVELVGSRVRSHAGSATSETGGEMTTIQLHDIVQFRENETVLGAGHIARVWDKPKADPYVTIRSEGRTFVRCSSAVTVTRKADQ